MIFLKLRAIAGYIIFHALLVILQTMLGTEHYFTVMPMRHGWHQPFAGKLLYLASPRPAGRLNAGLLPGKIAVGILFLYLEVAGRAVLMFPQVLPIVWIQSLPPQRRCRRF